LGVKPEFILSMNHKPVHEQIIEGLRKKGVTANRSHALLLSVEAVKLLQVNA